MKLLTPRFISATFGLFMYLFPQFVWRIHMKRRILQRNKTNLLILVVHICVENELWQFKKLLQLNSSLYMGGTEHLHKHMAQYNKPALQVKIHHSICIWRIRDLLKTVMIILWMEEAGDKKAICVKCKVKQTENSVVLCFTASACTMQFHIRSLLHTCTQKNRCSKITHFFWIL